MCNTFETQDTRHHVTLQCKLIKQKYVLNFVIVQKVSKWLEVIESADRNVCIYFIRLFPSFNWYTEGSLDMIVEVNVFLMVSEGSLKSVLRAL